MWQDPPEPPKPKKKKTKTQIDDEGNEVIIELSEDESSDEEEKVKIRNSARNVHSTNNPFSLSLSLCLPPCLARQELPHHRIVRNIRRFFAEVGDNKELRSSTIENMLLALPTASKSK